MTSTIKISQLPSESSPSTADLVPIVKSATLTTEQTPLADIIALIATGTDGWTNLPYTPNTVTDNGNRSYSLVFNSVDLTGTLSNGMRIRTTRTVAAPTQCTNLNGTTQYYSKSSPAGMTFTDTWSTSAWIKLTSYGSYSTIESRYNGTSGWQFAVNSSGQLVNQGNNGGAGNARLITSQQSIPLNKWTHVFSSFQMSDHTSTTCKIAINGVDVPATITTAGTNPTAIIQAGNLEIGSQNGGSTFFPGEIAQCAVFSAVISEATNLTYLSQGLAGTETSLISAYSFNNSINDLNANANNLTANGSAVATTVDSPFAQNDTAVPLGSLDYGVIMKKSFSTNTTIVVQVPEGCTIPTSGGISAVAYSTHGTPYGFPRGQNRWRISSLLNTANSTTSNATFGAFISNGWALTVPIGEWIVGWTGNLVNTTTTVVWFNLSSTALTGLSQSAALAVSRFEAPVVAPTSGTTVNYVNIRQPQSVAAQVSYIMYSMGATTAGTISGNDGTTEIFAENPYV